MVETALSREKKNEEISDGDKESALVNIVVTHMFCGICRRTPEEEEEEDLHLTLMVQVQPFSQEQIILFYRRFTSAEGCGRLMRKKKMMMMMS